MNYFNLTIVISGFLLLGCNQADTKNTLTTDEKNIMTAKLDTVSGEVLENILGIQVRKKFKEKYSGHYQYYINDDSIKILHGQFYFAHADSGFYLDPMTQENIDDMFSVSKISYTGEYREYKKNGKFIEKLLDDDGVDLYAEWQIIIDFVNDNCKGAKFMGAIGHIMPLTTTYSFSSIDTCSFDKVERLAWTEWEKEYDKQKNSH